MKITRIRTWITLLASVPLARSRLLRKAVSLCLAASLTVMPAVAGPALSQLEKDLRGPSSATALLTGYCARLHLASPPVIRAVRVTGIALKPGASTRALLHVKADDAVHYRRVRLMCGDHLLSEADNWYVPGRLTAAMNKTLDTSETPFGAVVKPLAFHRRLLRMTPRPDPVHALRVTALLQRGDGQPFSLVVENYSRLLVKEEKYKE